MESREIVLKNEKGLHLRPAGKVCDLALRFQSRTEMKVGTGVYNLKSMLSVLSAQVTDGTKMEIVCSGTNEREALTSICALLEHLDENGSEVV